MRGIWSGVLIVAVVGGGFAASRLLQPERSADVDKCIERSVPGSVGNQCDQPINLVHCVFPVGAERRCSFHTLAAGGRTDVEVAGSVYDFACRDPWQPVEAAGELNASSRRWACREG